MNSVFNKLKSAIMRGGKKKSMLISVVILVEIILLLVVATYAWVETVSSIKITNAGNDGTVDTYVFTEAMIGEGKGTIDIGKYFKQSGDMHLAPASSADGRTLFFPKANLASGFTYRKGNVSDKNTAYLSVSFKVRADTNADFFFDQVPTFSALGDDIRVSVTSQSEGSTESPVTEIFSNSASTTAVVNSTSGATGATSVKPYADHIKGKSSTARLFAVGANETKIVTINVWLQKKTGANTDLTNVMSQAISISNLGITSSLTPRHVTLIPTPTWDTDSPTYYAWCWDAPNDNKARLYKLDLDENDEHYSFDYNGTYKKTTFVRAVSGCTVEPGIYNENDWPFTSGSTANTNGYMNQTADTSIPNDPVDPTYIIETLNGGSNSKSTGSWHDPATIKLDYVTDQSSTWGTLSATTYIGTTTSTHVMEQTNSSSQKHTDTVHAWPGKKIKLVASAKTNYAFVGWYDNEEGTGTALSTSATYTTDAPATAAEVTYYAKFKETCTLTIYRTVDGSTSSTAAAGTITINGSTTGNTATSKTVTVDKGSSVTFSASAATGYTFAGFYTTQTGSTTATSPVTLNSNTTYYARFTTNTHTVNLNTIGSTGSTVQYGSETAATSVEKTGVKYNSSVTIKANPASGYKFVGWYTNSSGTGTAASTNASYTFTMGDADVTYYAKFEQLDIYLTGYINGSDVSDTTHHFTAGSNGVYTYTYKFTGGSDQWITIYDGTNAYHPASSGAGSGTAADTSLTDTTPAGINGNKWKVDACKGTTVTFTWNSVNKTLSWAFVSRELYLEPNSNWTQSSARFAAYAYGNGDNWYSMTSAGSGYYKVTIPATYPNVIFARMNGGNTTNNWSNKWNQSGDLTIPSDKNCFTVPDGAWDGSTTTWSLY